MTHTAIGGKPPPTFLPAFHIKNRQLFGVKKYLDVSLNFISLDISDFFS